MSKCYPQDSDRVPSDHNWDSNYLLHSEITNSINLDLLKGFSGSESSWQGDDSDQYIFLYQYSLGQSGGLAGFTLNCAFLMHLPN